MPQILPLLKVDQLVARSIYKTIRRHIIDHGFIPDEDLYLDTEVDKYNQDRQNIINTKGYCIDCFSESSDRYKGMKNSPRIVIQLARVYDGEVGMPMTVITQKPDGTYLKSMPTGKTANLIMAIHLISITSDQSATLNSILSNVLGERAVVYYYNNPDECFFIYQTNFSDMDNPIDNIKEKIYFYTVPDAKMAPDKVIQENVPTLKEVNTKTYHGDELLDQDTII